MKMHPELKRTVLIIAVVLATLIQADAARGSEPAAGHDILPTPKKMEPTGKRFLLNESEKPAAMILLDSDERSAVIAAREINDRITALGGRPLPTIADTGMMEERFPGMNIIRLAVSQDAPLHSVPAGLRAAANEALSRGEQGYLIRFSQERRGRTALLAGAGRPGLLHAGSSFRLLIMKEGTSIFASEAQIADWPDFQNRGLPVWPLPGSFEEFRKSVDWALRYKFNRMYTYATRAKGPDGFALPTAAERRYLKKINAYAQERGIRINYALTWAVAPASQEGSKQAYQDAVLFNNQYYSWGDDVLLKNRAREIARFVRETGAESLLFHCIDTFEESWDKRGKNDRERFGDDRASADANVINIFTAEIRSANPGIELQFVAYPYHANFDLPGNERYKSWMAKLTASIPQDVYLAVTELNRDRTDSWVALVKQPLVHWINGKAFQWGRFFSTLPAYTKTAFYPGRDRDIIIYWEPIGHFNGEVMQLIAAEYAWNVDAAGSGWISEESGGRVSVGGRDLRSRRETAGGADANTWAWYQGTQDPGPAAGALLLTACRLEFGQAAAPYLADFFRNNPVGWRSPDLFGRVLQDTMSGNEQDASSDQLVKAQVAKSSLKKALETNIDGAARARVQALLKHTGQQTFAIIGATAYYTALHLSGKGRTFEALQELKKGRDQLADLKREMEQSRIWSDEALAWMEAGSGRLNLAEDGLRRRGSANRISNPGFEEGSHDRRARQSKPVPHWSSSGPFELTDDSHTGDRAAHMTLRPSDDFIYLEQPITVPAGCEAIAEFWVKKDGEFRVLPMLQYRDKDRSMKVEELVAQDFPFAGRVPEYTKYNGRLPLASHVTQAVFKMYADWRGFTPAGEKNLYIDDVVVDCVVRK